MRIQFREIKFPGKQEDHGANRSDLAVASRLALGRLEQIIESFQKAVGLARFRPSDDTLDMWLRIMKLRQQGIHLGAAVSITSDKPRRSNSQRSFKQLLSHGIRSSYQERLYVTHSNFKRALKG